MAFRDLLLPIVTYPDTTPATALETAAAIAARLGGAVTVLALEIDLPEFRNVVANALVGLEDMAREQEAASARRARDEAKAFVAAAGKHGLKASAIVERVTVYDGPDHVRDHARTRDLTLIPVGPVVLGDVGIAEAVLFGSGRPVLVFPEGGTPAAGEAFGTVAIAWDGSRTAARAVADAMPALLRAKQVRVVVATGEKASVKPGLAKDLVRHLRAHDIAAEVDEIAGAGRPIGRVLESYVAEKSVDLLVMGGYGRSKASEFVLGGATASLLKAPPCPVLLSH